MFSSIISAAARHVPILVLTLVFFRLIPSLYSWLTKPSPPGPWKLSYEDVLEARAILGSLKLPTELALQVLDHAEYWPSLTFSSPQNPHGSSIKAAATHTATSAATLCLAADILTPEFYPALESVISHGETPRVKAIEFSIVSRDQGWTSEPTRGTFSTSSWLEVSLLRGWRPDARSPAGSNAQRVGVDTSLPPSCWLPSVFESPKAFQTHIVSNGWRLIERPEEAEQGPQGGEAI
ncbi:hypothetical protein E8E13_010653 [Curvularia kusanoi]|uniref:Uncharacterized protein n=1 Tax=Curvularia kusanoi TaxID=90978 RepID=A0A9P4WDC9_CURKU|nr:hypothetical protein E8E13_010653 [Curvularia kusanoi]